MHQYLYANALKCLVQIRAEPKCPCAKSKKGLRRFSELNERDAGLLDESQRKHEKWKNDEIMKALNSE